MQSAHIFFSIRYSKYNLSGFFGVQGFVLTVYQSDTSSESLKREKQKLTWLDLSSIYDFFLVLLSDDVIVATLWRLGQTEECVSDQKQGE